MSWQHPFRSVAMHILSQICREIYIHIISNPHSTLSFVMTASFIICSYPHINSNSVMTLSSIIYFNPLSTSNLSWKLLATSFPIHMALHICSWVHFLTSVPFHRAPQFKSRHHPPSPVLNHIVLQIGRECFLSHPFQST
jgi:hypothetical protein